MPQQPPGDSYLASDGNFYSKDGKYVFRDNKWVPLVPGSSAHSNQQLPPPPSSYRASDGNFYSADGRYILYDSKWVPLVSGSRTTSNQELQNPQSHFTQPGRVLGSTPASEIQASLYKQLGITPPLSTDLPPQAGPVLSHIPTGQPAFPQVELVPGIRESAPNDPFIAAFVKSWDAVTGRSESRK